MKSGRAGAVAAQAFRLPFLQAMTWAMMLTAISAGVLLPIDRPAGECRRASVSAETSKCCCMRSRRLWALRREPMAPT
ncbi:hypothetical protein D3C80_2088420 [compost metagenome]